MLGTFVTMGKSAAHGGTVAVGFESEWCHTQQLKFWGKDTKGSCAEWKHLVHARQL